jgi:hypothetical protein
VQSRELSAEEWGVEVGRVAPYWSEFADLAITRLSSEVPPEHHNAPASFLYWSSGDSLVQSLIFLDTVLSATGSADLLELQKRLATAIAGSWQKWSPFTKTMALHVLQPYFWANQPLLRALLDRELTEATDPGLTDQALRIRLRSGGKGLAETLSQLLQRVNALPGFEQVIRNVGESIGIAAVQANAIAAPAPSLREGAKMLWEPILLTGLDRNAKCSLITGVIWGAMHLVEGTKERAEQLANAWVKVANWSSEHWPFDPEAEDDERFPILAVASVLHASWDSGTRRRLFVSLAHNLERIMREGSLGDFCTLHFELGAELEGRRVTAQPPEGHAPVRSAIPDDLLIQLCRASADRVARWRTLGKRTDDLGWGGALAGHDTSFLVRQVFNYGEDREYLRREIPNVIDRLHQAGLEEVATELRVYLRRA